MIEANPENEFKLEIEVLVTKKKLGEIVNKCYKRHGPTVTAIMLDKIKAKGYHYSTLCQQLQFRVQI